MKKLCGCGCGNEMPSKDKQGRPRFFINGHQNRSRKPAKNTRNKMSAAQKGNKNHLGYKHSDETKKKISDAKKGEKNQNYGIKFSEEHNHKISIAHAGKILSKEYKNKISIAKKGKCIDENASQWMGGISFKPYCPKFNETFKEKIREMFDRVCFFCGKTEKINGRKLSVHHVSYNKNCLCGDTVCKFVPLCSSCHAKTNGNRIKCEQTIIQKLKLYEMITSEV